MKRTVSTASALAVSMALAFAGAATASPRTSAATALPGLPGGTASAANDVNDAGQIVGWARTATATHAVLWQHGVPVDLGALPGDTASYATAISNSGLIVGVSGANPDEPSETGRAVLWRDGEIIDLGLLPGGGYSAATDVNNAGQVVGCGQMAERGGLSLVHRGFVWVDGAAAILPPLQPESDLLSTSSCAMSINDQGVVAGNSAVYNVQTGELTRHAVTWRDGVLTDLGTVGGDPGNLTFATSINASGEIAGWGGTVDPNLSVFAVVWAGGDGRLLARPAGAAWSTASGINARGVVVGQYATQGETYGCRWIGGTVAALLPLPGDAYSAALGINNRGLIVGWSEDTSYGIHAVMWR